MEALAPLVSEPLGLERVPMEVSHENGTHRIKVGDDGEVEVQEVVSLGRGGRQAGEARRHLLPGGRRPSSPAQRRMPERAWDRLRLRGGLRLRQPVLLGGR